MPELLQKTLLISKSKLLSWIMHLGQAQERSAGDACVRNISIANITRHFFSSEKESTSDPGSSRSRFTFAARRIPSQPSPLRQAAAVRPPQPCATSRPAAIPTRSIVHEQQNHSVSQNVSSSRGLAGTNEHGVTHANCLFPFFNTHKHRGFGDALQVRPLKLQTALSRHGAGHGCVQELTCVQR